MNESFVPIIMSMSYEYDSRAFTMKSTSTSTFSL